MVIAPCLPPHPNPKDGCWCVPKFPRAPRCTKEICNVFFLGFPHPKVMVNRNTQVSPAVSSAPVDDSKQFRALILFGGTWCECSITLSPAISPGCAACSKEAQIALEFSKQWTLIDMKAGCKIASLCYLVLDFLSLKGICQEGFLLPYFVVA